VIHFFKDLSSHQRPAMNRRRSPALHCRRHAALFALVAPGQARSGAYPNKPVKIVIISVPQRTDIMARFVAEELRGPLGSLSWTTARVGTVVATTVAKCRRTVTPADDVEPSHPVTPHIQEVSMTRSRTSRRSVGLRTPFICRERHRAGSHAAGVRELREANKGKLNYAYGTPAVQIPAEALNRLENLRPREFRTRAALALTDVIGNQAQFLVVDLASARPTSPAASRAGGDDPRRSSLAPDLPTIEETRCGILTCCVDRYFPAGLPKDIQEKLSATLQKVLAKPDVRERIIAAGAEPTPSDIPAFTALVKRQLEIWGRKVADAGIQPE
jgi:hypothetical protein